jgi:hypothetical protein
MIHPIHTLKPLASTWRIICDAAIHHNRSPLAKPDVFRPEQGFMNKGEPETAVSGSPDP